MSRTTVQEPAKVRVPLNGVDTPNLFATINAVAGNPPLAKFQFRATNRWVAGTHSRGTIESFYGAGSEQKHKRTFTLEADHPAVLVGADNAPLPVEYLLYGLASCITSGIANIAAARGVTLTEVEAKVEGDIDLRGILGLSGDVRNGYDKIRATFTIKGDAPEEKLRQIVEQSKARSAVFDVLTNGVPVDIGINVG
ncbi:MAG TPA: OsmC family protein [Vicinamibacterales bacterium]|nr:OsmC family protein [Vicinamibacterales bacterium]